MIRSRNSPESSYDPFRLERRLNPGGQAAVPAAVPRKVTIVRSPDAVSTDSVLFQSSANSSCINTR